jgi:MFS family permease
VGCCWRCIRCRPCSGAARGRLADRRGLHLPLLLAVAAAIAGAALAAAWPVFGALCVSALLLGASANTAQIALQRHVGRSATDVGDRKRAFSWIAIAPAAANFAGPLLAGLLIDHAGAQAGDCAPTASPLP